MKLPVGVSDFQELIQEEYLFVDKSSFIKDVMNNGAKVILITRPRRFGKTMNMSMLYHFLQMNFIQDSNLFEGLAISKDTEFCKKQQHQYPVVFISFKGVKQSDYASAYTFIADLIRRLYETHRYLLEEDLLSQSEKKIFNRILDQEANIAQIGGSIRQLSEYMQRKFGKSAIILIDEYDTPIQEAYLKNYYDEMVELMRGILGEALKDNTALAKAVLTGITKISQESMFSDLNNVEVYSLLREEYGQYFGFTETEVIKLLTETGKDIKIKAIKDWYNGYQIGKHTLYNPWSIISCLNNSQNELKAYWVNTSSNAPMVKLLRDAGTNVKQCLEALLQGDPIEQPLAEDLVFPDIEKHKESLWSLLLYAGYLKVLSSELRGNRLMAQIAIPNKEVSFVYDKIVEQWFDATISLESYDAFMQSLANGDMAGFKTYLSSYLIQSSSYFDFPKDTIEQIFHVFVLGLVVGLREHYKISSNQESGLGRVDVKFIPRDKKRKGIILEFKVTENAEALLSKAQEALQQIKDKRYAETFKQHEVSNVLAIGLAFCGKQLDLAYEELCLK